MSAAAGSSKTPWATAAARATRSTASSGSCAPAPRSSPTSSGPGWRKAITAHDGHLAVYVAWSCAQQLRAAYRHRDPSAGRRIAEKILATFPTCPVPEIARLRRSLKRWESPFLAYFDTGRSNNGGTEALIGLIELHRRVARGFRNRDNYQLRMLLIGGGLSHPHLK